MLKEPVTFQRKERTPTGSGGFTETWETIRETRAHVNPVSGSERFLSMRVDAVVSLRVTVRYFRDVLEGDRVVIRDKAHNIRFIDNVEFADRWLVLTVEGGVAV